MTSPSLADRLRQMDTKKMSFSSMVHFPVLQSKPIGETQSRSPSEIKLPVPRKELRCTGMAFFKKLNRGWMVFLVSSSVPLLQVQALHILSPPIYTALHGITHIIQRNMVSYGKSNLYFLYMMPVLIPRSWRSPRPHDYSRPKPCRLRHRPWTSLPDW